MTSLMILSEINLIESKAAHFEDVELDHEASSRETSEKQVVLEDSHVATQTEKDTQGTQFT